MSKLSVITLITLSSAALLLVGCAAQKYRAQPISPAATASTIQARSLNDRGLRQFVETNLGHQAESWPLAEWDLDALTLAAFYFNPDIELVRARLNIARAGTTTAGARPNPSVGVAPGVTNSPESPWLFRFDFGLPLETAGKRGYRLLAADGQVRAAQLSLLETAWKVRSQVRVALLDHLFALRGLELLHSEERVRSASIHLLQVRLDEGEIGRPELNLARVGLTQLELQLTAAQDRVSQTRTALALAMGVPGPELTRISLSWPDLNRPPTPQALALGSIQRAAVLNRLDIQRALAEYAVAEANLQLEIAKQYPDIQLGPAYDFDEGHHKFVLGVNVTLPIFNRNQGPIAEAFGQREAAAAAFMKTQAEVISEDQQALAHYEVTLQELGQAETAFDQLQKAREEMTRYAVAVGESDRQTLTDALLETSAAAQTQVSSLYQAQLALGQLEDSVQQPLAYNTLPVTQLSDHLEHSPKREKP